MNLISEYFYIWVVIARPPAVYDELLPYTHGHSHNAEPTAHQRQVMEHVPGYVSCLWEQNPRREISPSDRALTRHT